MIRKLFKYSFAFVILLHCLGITQLVSSYARDKSVFVGMLNMTEEETKEDKCAKEDADDLKHVKKHPPFSLSSIHLQDKRLYISDAKVRITDQFISDNLTPPPDFAG